ncbi:U-box domain-containing protein [Aureococcus anophagefferens]|nr:U-box domain-containing protein [Aureococcus anophagefferens]
MDLAGMDLSQQLDRMKESFLWAAAKGGREEEVESLLSIGADVNWVSNEGDTPLIAACRHGHRGVAALLLAHGGDASATTSGGGEGALHLCCRRGDEDLSALLVDAGADGDRGPAGATAFDAGVESGHEQMVARLRNLQLRHGAAAPRRGAGADAPRRASPRAHAPPSAARTPPAARSRPRGPRRAPGPVSRALSLPALPRHDDDYESSAESLSPDPRAADEPRRRAEEKPAAPSEAFSMSKLYEGEGESRPSARARGAAIEAAMVEAERRGAAAAEQEAEDRAAQRSRREALPLPGDDILIAPPDRPRTVDAEHRGFFARQLEEAERALAAERSGREADKRKADAIKAQSHQLLSDLMHSQSAASRLRDERARLQRELRTLRGHELAGLSAEELSKLEADVTAAARRIACYKEKRLRAALRVPDAYVCPITRELMHDPVFASDGHTYERDAIQQWLISHDTSPKTGLILDSKHLVPNFAIRSAIDELKARNDNAPDESPAAQKQGERA